MSKPEFVRRRSYPLDMGLYEDQNSKDHKILHNGQHLIMIYDSNGTVMGRFQTYMRDSSMKKFPYLYLTRVPQLPGEHLVNEFNCYIRCRNYRMCEIFEEGGNLQQFVSDSKTSKFVPISQYEDSLSVHRISNLHLFHIEIIGGDHFQETNIKAIHTMLENKVIPNDLVRMLKPFLY